MPITPDASPDEYRSPFFIKNKAICEIFDQFIINLNGETNGAYNAWSYNAIGKINHVNEWQFRIKKSTYSSGNLLLSSKFQNLHIASEWIAKQLETTHPDFLIRKRSVLDIFKILTLKNWSKLIHFNHYVIYCEHPNNDLILQLTQVLSDLFKEKQVFSIQYKSPELIINLRTAEIHEDLILKVIKTVT